MLRNRLYRLHRLFRPEVLVIYIGIAIVYSGVVWLAAKRDSYTDALLMATDLFTGTSPASFPDAHRQALELYQPLWVSAWILHIMSWIFIPAVVGVLVAETVLFLDRELARHEATEGLREFGRRQGLSGEALDGFVAQVLEDIAQSSRGRRRRDAQFTPRNGGSG